MEVKLNARDLATELGLALGVIETKTTIPVLAHALLEASGKEVKLAVSDLELSLQTSCPANVEAEGSATVPLQWLHDYLRLVPEDSEISLSASADHVIDVVRGEARSGLQGGDREKFPDLQEMPDATVSLPLEGLAKATRKTLVSASADKGSYGYQGGILMILDSKSMTLVSTDGHRLSLYAEQADLGGLDEESRCLIPRKAMVNLEKVLAATAVPKGKSGTVEFGQDGNHLFFRAGHRQLTCQKMTATFPEYTRVIPNDGDMTIKCDLETSEFASALRLVDQFAPQESHAVQLLLEDGELQLSAKTAISGESEAAVSVDYKGDAFTVGMSARSVLDFLGVCDSDKVTLALKDPESAAQLTVPGLADGQQHRYVVMPIRQ